MCVRGHAYGCEGIDFVCFYDFLIGFGNYWTLVIFSVLCQPCKEQYRGGFRGGASGACPPPKIGKNMIFFWA